MTNSAASVKLSGAWRQPVNTSADEKGGIHDDDTAQELGFSGGTIAGSIHMEQFVPLLVEYFGEDWWRRGSLSLYFLAATQHLQPVQCHLQAQTSARANVWMLNEQGDTVMAGTAAMGLDEDSEISKRLAQVRPATDIRMFADVQVGVRCAARPVHLTSAVIDERLKVITEPLPCYTDPSLFGGRVLPMVPLVHAFRSVEPDIVPIKGPFVGLFGAIEVAYLKGPIVADREYLADGKVLALSESPKTEIVWHTESLRDANSGEELARMIKMDRLMKDASPLWS